MITEPVIPNILRDIYEKGIRDGREEQNVIHITNMIMHSISNADILAVIPGSTPGQIEAIREKVRNKKNLN